MEEMIVREFNSLAPVFDERTGGASNELAARELSLSPPLSNKSVILDIGCGTGPVVEEVQRYFSSVPAKAAEQTKVKVIAVDASDGMINVVKQKAQKAAATNAWSNIESLTTHVTFAERLDETFVPTNTVTHAYSNFGLYFFTDPVKVYQNVYRTLAPGGVAMFATRAEEDIIPAMRQTEKRMKPGNENFDVTINHSFQDPAFLKDTFVRGGFNSNTTKVVKEEVYMRASSVNEMATILTDTWITRMRPEGWTSADEREKWIEAFCEDMVKDPHFVSWGEKGVGIRMVINIGIGTK